MQEVMTVAVPVPEGGMPPGTGQEVYVLADGKMAFSQGDGGPGEQRRLPEQMAFGMGVGGCGPLAGAEMQQEAGLFDASAAAGMQSSLFPLALPQEGLNDDRWESCWEWVKTGWCPRGMTCRWEHPPIAPLGFPPSAFHFWAPEEAAQWAEMQQGMDPTCGLGGVQMGGLTQSPMRQDMNETLMTPPPEDE